MGFGEHIGCGRGRWRAVVLGIVAALQGCADVEHIGWELASVRKVAWMQMEGQRLEGYLQLRPDRTGSLWLSGSGEIASCSGTLRFTAVSSGRIDTRCSNGAVVDLQFALSHEVKGYAHGTFNGMPVALTFGMDAPEARAYLAVSPAP